MALLELFPVQLHLLSLSLFLYSGHIIHSTDCSLENPGTLLPPRTQCSLCLERSFYSDSVTLILTSFMSLWNTTISTRPSLTTLHKIEPFLPLYSLSPLPLFFCIAPNTTWHIFNYCLSPLATFLTVCPPTNIEERDSSMMVDTMNSEIGFAGFELQLHYLLPVKPWASDLNSLHPSFLICSVEVIIIPYSELFED